MARRLISRPAASLGTAGRVWVLYAAAAAVAVPIALFVVSRLTLQEPQTTFAGVYGGYGLTQPGVVGEAAAANISNLKQRLSNNTPILSHYQSLKYPDFSHMSRLWVVGSPTPYAVPLDTVFSIDAKVSIAARAFAKGNESEAESLIEAFRVISELLHWSVARPHTKDIRFAHAVLYAVPGRPWPGGWLFPSFPGEFRTGSASPVADTLSAHPLEIEAALGKLLKQHNSRCKFVLNQSLDAAVCALRFYVNFIRVYPFPDGNRKLGMAILWAMLAAKGLPPPSPASGRQLEWDGVSGSETKFIEEQIVVILSSL